MLQYIGQGEGETKWKGCACDIDWLVKDIIYINYYTSV
jgi:hypothetical protein